MWEVLGLMLTAYLFDKQRGEHVEAWQDAAQTLSATQLLWIDLSEPTGEEAREVTETFGLNGIDAERLRAEDCQAELEQCETHIRVTAIAVSDAETDQARERVALECLVGNSWVVTVRNSAVAAIDDFRDRAEGSGELGLLDTPSFLASLLEWVVTSYLRAFDEIQATLEEFDVAALRSPSGDTDRQIGALVDARRRVGNLRRALAPHREVFTALSHSEFDPLSSEESAARFRHLSASLEQALASARDAKDAVIGSFDVLIVRTEHRTNEIMKVLTLASILLLPGALIAGVMGMNVNFNGSTFIHSSIFWIVVVAIVMIAAATLAAARARRWI
jgi:Mg2+ and Co2+ transporter CorA